MTKAEFIAKYMIRKSHRSVKDDRKETESDLDTILRNTAKKAYYKGCSDAGAAIWRNKSCLSVSFEDYWNSL